MRMRRGHFNAHGYGGADVYHYFYTLLLLVQKEPLYAQRIIPVSAPYRLERGLLGTLTNHLRFAKVHVDSLNGNKPAIINERSIR